MPAWNSIEGVVTGVVRSVNEKGLKLEGYDVWHNVSKYAVGCVLPERGATVALTLDKAGFIRGIDSLDALPQPVSGASDAHSTPDVAQGKLTPPAAPSTRDRTITRLAILKAAAEFGAARPNLKSGDVLAIAATWERWVMREEETTYELTDAF